MRTKSNARVSGIRGPAPARRRRAAARPESDGMRIADSAPALISLAHCRELLGEEADGRSDADIETVRRYAAALANVIVQAFLDDQSTDK
jgi:hypothetical protein